MRFSVAAIGVALLLLACPGCRKPVKPGVSYSVAILTKSNDGKPTPREPVTRVEGATVESRQEIPHESQTISLVVRKTQYGKATFDVTFPDNTTQMVQVKEGEPKDVLPKGQKVGVRIELQGSH